MRFARPNPNTSTWNSRKPEHSSILASSASCVALANEGGGHLLLGIADKLPHSVVGTSAVNDPVGMAEKLFQILGFRVDVEEVNHPDGRVVVFYIPLRPRGTAYHLEGTYLPFWA